MFLKKVLNQPNLAGTVMIVLLVSAGFVYAFAFDGFNIETVTDGEVDAWLAQEGVGNSGSNYTCNSNDCNEKNWSNCPARGSGATGNCTGCTYTSKYCSNSCTRSHTKCPCPVSGCSKYNGGQTSCPSSGSKKCPERNKS